MFPIKLNPFAISGIIVTATYVPLFLFIIKRSRSKLGKLFSIYILTKIIWGICSFLIGTVNHKAIATAIIQIALVDVFFIPILLLHAVNILTKEKSNLLLYLGYAQAVLFSVLTLYGQLFHTEWKFNTFYYFSGNKIFFLSFICWMIFISAGHFKLMIFYQTNYPEYRQGIKFILISFLGCLAAFTNWAPGLNLNIYPWGNFFTTTCSIFVSYALLKHHIVEISTAIKRSIIYSFWATLLSILYLISVIFIERGLQSSLGYTSIYLTIFIAFIIGILIIPLKDMFQNIIEKSLFKASMPELADQNENFQKEIADKQKHQTVATLASSIAHEIKNPLTSIKTFVEYLPKKADKPAFLAHFQEVVGGELKRIEDLTKQLLEYAKPSPLELQSVQICRIIDHSLNLLSNEIRRGKIEIRKDFGVPYETTLMADPNKLEQAFLNLFLNAIEAMGDEGGKLTVDVRNKGLGDLRIKAKNPTQIPKSLTPQILEIAISDTGPGIPKAQLPKIFDPFYTTKPKGTGLGLSIVKNIVEDHGGKIKILHNKHARTTFNIEIPLN